MNNRYCGAINLKLHGITLVLVAGLQKHISELLTLGVELTVTDSDGVTSTAHAAIYTEIINCHSIRATDRVVQSTLTSGCELRIRN